MSFTITRAGHSPRLARTLFAGAVTLAVATTLWHAHLGDTAVYEAGGRAAVTSGDVYGFLIGPHGFTYPPFAALVIAGLAWLPRAGLWLAVNALSIAALVSMLRLCVPRDLADMRAGDVRAAARLSLLVLAVPVTETFRFGQVDLVLAALALADLLRRRRGVLLGLTAAIKLTPAIFVVYLLLRGRYREAATATGVFAGSVAAGALLLPRASARYWFHDLEDGAGTGGFTHVDNQSLHGLAIRAFGPGIGAPLWIVAALLALVGGLALARRVSRSGNELLAVGIVGITGCLVSPLSWNHHWVWIVPAIAGLRATALIGSPWFRRWLTFASLVLAAWSVVPAPPVVGTGLLPLALITAGAALWTAHRDGTAPVAAGAELVLAGGGRADL